MKVQWKINWLSNGSREQKKQKRQIKFSHLRKSERISTYIFSFSPAFQHIFSRVGERWKLRARNLYEKKALSLTQKINSSLFLTQFPPFSLHRSRIAFPLHIKFSAFSHSLAGVRRPKIIHNLLYFSRCIRVLYIVHVPSLHLHTYRFSWSLSLLMIMKPPSNLRPGQLEVCKQKKKAQTIFFLFVEQQQQFGARTLSISMQVHEYESFSLSLSLLLSANHLLLVSFSVFSSKFWALPSIARGGKVVLRRFFVMSFVISRSLLAQSWVHLKLWNLLQRDRKREKFICMPDYCGSPWHRWMLMKARRRDAKKS